MYDYRKMTAAQRREAVEYRRLRERPWHSPPHWKFQGLLQFMISGSCYEHHRIIGSTPERMTECEDSLLHVCNRFAANVYAWCVLPNHTCYCRLINFRICGLNLEGSTVAHRSNGTVRMIAEGGKFGTIVWIVALSHIVTFGQV